jgi:Nucleotidyltransferase of unknown function (DUF6036)
VPLDEFFQEIDARWTPSQGEKIRLRIIGSAALMLQTTYERGTKDSDILETADLTQEIKAQLLLLAGVGTEIHSRRRIYIEFVAGGLPFLPQVPIWRDVELNTSLRHFEIVALDVVDVVVSKLKRFHANDMSDISAMIEKDLVPHDLFISRFRHAVDVYQGDARAEELSRYVQNLHRIERDNFNVTETLIDLPDWT